MMDSEIRVSKEGDEITVVCTRDKAAPSGTTVKASLWPMAPAAVLRESRATEAGSTPDWMTYPLPQDLMSYRGLGSKLVPLLSRYMACCVSSEFGITRAALLAELKIKPSDGTARSAWEYLIKEKRIVPVQQGKSVSASTPYYWRNLRVAKAAGGQSGDDAS